MNNSPPTAVLKLTSFGAKLVATYVALLIASTVAGMLLYSNAKPPPGFEPQAYQRAMLAVTLLHALILYLLASRSRLSVRGTAIVLFCVFFGVQTALTMAETLFFITTGSLHFDPTNMPLDAASGAITALVGSVSSSYLFRRRCEKPESASAGPQPRLTFAALVILYPVVYWSAGLAIALQSAAVRKFYGDSLNNINPLALLILQLGRGIVWTGLALLCVRTLRAPPVSRAVLVGLAFAILMIAQLIYPNALMPGPVRAVHAVELFVSNILFGVAACLAFSRSIAGEKEAWRSRKQS